MGQPTLNIRAAAATDCPLLLDLIRALAGYEKLEDEVVGTVDDLREHLFGERVYAEALIGEWGGHAVAYALFFHSYSTFLTRPGLYLEDLFVLPEHRGRGIGKAMLARVAALAVERGCGRLEWSVLDWNEPALAFYRSLAAKPVEGWTVHRLVGDALRGLAAAAD